MNQKQIEIAAKLYESRDIMLLLLGEEKFKAKVDEFRPLFEDLRATDSATEMETTLKILKGLMGNGQASLLAAAACTEIMEPSL